MARVRLTQRHRSSGVPDVQTPLPKFVDERQQAVSRLGQNVSKISERQYQLDQAIARAEADTISPMYMNQLSEEYKEFEIDSMTQDTDGYNERADKFFLKQRTRFAGNKKLSKNPYLKRSFFKQFNSFESQSKVQARQWVQNKKLKDISDQLSITARTMLQGADGDIESFKKNFGKYAGAVQNNVKVTHDQTTADNMKQDFYLKLGWAHAQSLAIKPRNASQKMLVYADKMMVQEQADVASVLAKHNIKDARVIEALNRAGSRGGVGLKDIEQIVDGLKISDAKKKAVKSQVLKESQEFLVAAQKVSALEAKKSPTQVTTKGVNFVSEYERYSKIMGYDDPQLPRMRQLMNKAQQVAIDERNLLEVQREQHRKQVTQSRVNSIMGDAYDEQGKRISLGERRNKLYAFRATGFGDAEEISKGIHTLNVQIDRHYVSQAMNKAQDGDFTGALAVSQLIMDPKNQHYVRSNISGAQNYPEYGSSAAYSVNQISSRNPRIARRARNFIKDAKTRLFLGQGDAEKLFLVNQGFWKSRYIDPQHTGNRSAKEIFDKTLSVYTSDEGYRKASPMVKVAVDKFRSSVEPSYKDYVALAAVLDRLGTESAKADAKLLRKAAQHLLDYDRGLELQEKHYGKQGGE